MRNIYKISLVGGLVFAIFDAICAFFAAFALRPFTAFWGYAAHIKFTGIGVESAVTVGTFIGGIVATFILGFVLTWLFVWLHGKLCCKIENK